MADQATLAGVTPHLTIGDRRAKEAIDFYKAAFGATEVARNKAGEANAPGMPMAKDDDRIIHAQLTVNDGSVMLNDDFPEFMGGNATAAPTAVTLHLEVDDADKWFDRAVNAGATVTMPLADQFWGDRYGQVKDPFGHSWSIGAPTKKD